MYFKIYINEKYRDKKIWEPEWTVKNCIKIFETINIIFKIPWKARDLCKLPYRILGFLPKHYDLEILWNSQNSITPKKKLGARCKVSSGFTGIP